MDTSEFQIDGWDVRVIHHSDWSGEAKVIYSGSDNVTHTVVLPARLLIELSRRAAIQHVREEIIGFLEQAE